ncbi:MAG: DUF86 domain-containing protein [Candidatus Omnitrophota bacterium]
MPKRGDFEFLSDIDEAIKRIESYTARKNLSDKLKKKYPNVDWKNIAGMRDKIIHFYFGVNWEIVWDVCRKRLPDIKPRIASALRTLEK